LYILGFGIELMTEIAKYLQFNVTFKLVDDGKYGSINEHGRWNGMIKEVKIYLVYSLYANFISANFITVIFKLFHKHLLYANFELFTLVQFFGQKIARNVF
jgi:hypothetical protein